MAVVLDGEHNVEKAIDLLKVALYEVDQRVVFHTRCKRILLFYYLLLLFLLQFLPFDWLRNVLFNFNKHVHWVSLEHARKRIIDFLVLIVLGEERLEIEGVRECPVEAFLRELVLVGVSDAHRNVVVMFDTTDLSPEEKFFKVIIGSLIE